MALPSAASSRSARSAWRTDISCPATYRHNEARLFGLDSDNPLPTFRPELLLSWNRKSSDVTSASLPGQRRLIGVIVRRRHRQVGGNGDGRRGMAARSWPGPV